MNVNRICSVRRCSTSVSRETLFRRPWKLIRVVQIAEKHGLFAASHGGDIALQLCEGPSDPEGSWKAWARVESTKR